MSHRLKLTLFVLAFNVIGFAEGYLLQQPGILWLLPVLLLTAVGLCGESMVVKPDEPSTVKKYPCFYPFSWLAPCAKLR